MSFSVHEQYGVTDVICFTALPYLGVRDRLRCDTSDGRRGHVDARRWRMPLLGQGIRRVVGNTLAGPIQFEAVDHPLEDANAKVVTSLLGFWPGQYLSFFAK